jgi:hypothetical protein
MLGKRERERGEVFPMLVELIAFNFFVKNGCQWKKNNLKEIECKTDVP